MVSRNSKVHNSASSPFFLIIIRYSCLDEISWSVCISKFLGSLHVSYFRTDSNLWMYHLFVWSNLNLLLISPGDHLVHSILSSLILFLCKFAVFTYYGKRRKSTWTLLGYKKMWNMKVSVVPVVTSSIGTVTKGLVQGLDDFEIRGRVKTIQSTVLLRSARVLRKVLET